jgi:DNA-binding response OmpR family regulator
MLPKLDGLEVCTRIRQGPGAKDPYILMLTARGEEIDRIIGLSTGADDYLVKPFSPRELVARVRACCAAACATAKKPPPKPTAPPTLASTSTSAPPTARTSPTALELLDLTPLEFDLLATFMSYPGRVWSRQHLIEKLWGEDFFGDERVVDTHIARLRKKVEPDSSQPTFVKRPSPGGVSV